MSLTQREQARRVQYITGHARDGRCRTTSTGGASPIRRRRPSIYMPVEDAAGLGRASVRSGSRSATPSVAVAYATRAEERTIAGSIADLPRLCLRPRRRRAR